MIVDSHVHLYHKRFDADREDVIARAHAADVTTMLMPAIDLASVSAAIDLCRQHEGLYAMSAIHPSDVKDADEEDLEQVERFCADPHVIAVGETGLDYYWDRSFDEKQQEFFRRHIRIAISLDLPVVIHNREATNDVIRILREEHENSSHRERLRGVLHCFGGPVDVVEQAIELGFYFGIGGTVTYKNSGVADVVREIPIDRILVETDAPFLAPVPRRGKRNEPAYTAFVVEFIAQVKNLSVDDVASATTRNAKALFEIV
ncbi:MAG: TatD family hydrolase [Rhodothermales bacterium]|nr:TatD family hydrolase [Rhodothermales bacterium]